MSIPMETASKVRLGHMARGLFVAGVIALAWAPVQASAAGADSRTELASLVQPPVAADAAKTEKAPVKPRPVYLGRSPYICTPSGFGRTASCFQRAGLN